MSLAVKKSVREDFIEAKKSASKRKTVITIYLTFGNPSLLLSLRKEALTVLLNSSAVKYAFEGF